MATIKLKQQRKVPLSVKLVLFLAYTLSLYNLGGKAAKDPEFWSKVKDRAVPYAKQTAEKINDTYHKISKIISEQTENNNSKNLEGSF